MSKVRGTIQRVTYQNTENGYAVLRVEAANGKEMTVTGTFVELLSGAKLAGVEYEFAGDWKNTKYGRQFACQSSEMMTSEVKFFLSKFVKGIGPATAARILQTFDESEIPKILSHDPKKLQQVKGIGPNRIAKMQQSWTEFEHLRRLSGFFEARGAQISTYLIIRLYQQFGDDAQTQIEENPYVLTKIRGIGFKTADTVALAIGVEEDAPNRMHAALMYLLQAESEENGSTLITITELAEKARELFDDALNTEVFKQVVKQLIAENELYYDAELQSVGLFGTIRNEIKIGKFLTRSGNRRQVREELVEAFLTKTEAEQGFPFSKKQRLSIKEAASGKAQTIAISGYAGTGKTTSSKTLLNLLATHYCPRDEIVCCAFTGMAAARAREVTGFEALTIHSLLRYRNGDFLYNRTNRLPYSVICVDETTMNNSRIMRSLTDAARDEAIFIMLGDPAQLPPIGPGNIFVDALNRELVSCTQLTEIYRQSADSVLTYFADYIRRGQVPPDYSKSGWKDFDFEEVEPHSIYMMKRRGESEEAIRAARDENNLAILGRIIRQAAIASKKHEDPCWDFQVLTPMRRGILGIENINVELQKVLNPAGFNKPEILKDGRILRVNDKLVHLSNRDMPVMPKQIWEKKQKFIAMDFPDTPSRVFNGSLGKVISLNKTEETFIVELSDSRYVQYDFVDFGECIEHAFGLTIHKSQGSQYKEVVIPMSTSHFMMLNSQILYTGMTRAIENVSIYGQKYAFEHACKNVTSANRKTFLALTQDLKSMFDSVSEFTPDFERLKLQLESSMTPVTTQITEFKSTQEAQTTEVSQPVKRSRMRL
jgi:exodeoxyribonuclease V alpha subunit